MKFGIEQFYENLPKISKFIKMGKRRRSLNVKTNVGFIVTGDVKSPLSRSLILT
jgi:hypothetical protein